ncbi:ABC transporter substrate-binding protein [Fredinandcohnia humi]
MSFSRKFGIGAIVLLFLVSIVLTACGGDEAGGKSDEKVLNVFNWSEYLPESVIEQFEEETGIKVNYDTYSSNEEMLAKLQAGNTGYDITVASTYFIEIMRKQEMLEKVNKDNIPNLKNIGESFLGTDADPDDEYSIPYMWGKAVIAYNEDLVTKEVKGYEDLFDPEFKNNLVVLDDVRVIIGNMLAILGYSQNSTSEKELEEAKEKLLELKPNIKAFDSDSPKTLLVSGEVKAGIVWDAEAILAARENPAIKMIFPEEGMNLWQDNFVIPKGAPHKENAEKFIDFILRPEISKEISMEYPYGNPNVEALKLLPDDVRESLEVPEEELLKGEYNIDVGEATQIYDRIWSEVKNN